MTPPRADKGDTPPKSTAKPTVYEISKSQGPDGGTVPATPLAWQPVGEIETTRGAVYAIGAWAEEQGDKFKGGRLRAVPKSMVTERQVTVETKRQLTLGAP